MRRRRFLQGVTAAGAVVLSRPGGVLAGTLAGGPTAQVASRASRLFPGSFLVHADMHNHSLFSDGDGDPAQAFVSMRDNGLDVAALTDHAVLGGPVGLALGACGSECASIRGIADADWAATRHFADQADTPESFVAIRGFEWSSPTLGHMNVWFSTDWVDPERTLGLVGVEGLELLTDEIPGLGPAVGEPLAEFVGDLPITGLTMAPFFDWLRSSPGSGVLGGGLDGIAGFNHPGREPGRFGQFTYDPRLVDQVVSLELFNRTEDYLFEGTDRDDPSPLVQCLDAGWRPGLLGVTDEHGTDWGAPLDKGRGGLWVTDLSRGAVRRAMEQRAFFATRERGLRVDVAARSHTTGAGPVRMGSALAHDRGPVTIEIDVDKGAEWTGKPLLVQLLRTGSPLPTIVDTVAVVVPAPDEPVITITREIDRAAGDWLVVRITDPDAEPDGRAGGPWAEAGRAVAYASPFTLVAPGQAPSTPTTTAPPGAGTPITTAPATTAPAAGSPSAPGPGSLPATGGTSPLVGGAAAVGAAAIAALAARRMRVAEHAPDGHDHPHPHG